MIRRSSNRLADDLTSAEVEDRRARANAAAASRDDEPSAAELALLFDDDARAESFYADPDAEAY